MPFEPVILPTSLWIVLGVVVFLQLVQILGQIRLGGRLKRIERSQRISADAIVPRLEESLDERKSEVKEHKQQFKAFLDEDPSRNELPKKEQFAEFRKWRSATGLNWVSISETGHSPREKP